MPKPPFDCQACGACCCTTVELRVGDRVPRAMIAPGPRMATSIGHRCVALRGPVGERVECSIYADRPAICRAVQAGDEMCHAARALFKLPGGDMSARALGDALSNLLGRR